MTSTPRASLALVTAALSALGCESANTAADAGAELAPITLGDTTIRASRDGSFSVVVGGRALLSTPAAPVSADRYTESVRSAFGIWTHRRTEESAARITRASSLTREGDAAVLTAEGDGATLRLRFERVADTEVRITSDLTVPQAFQGATLRFRCEAASHFLGLGEQYNHVDHRGRRVPLFVSEQGIGRDPDRPNPFAGNHDTTYFPVPFFLDPRGFGLAVDTSARVVMDLCAEDPEVFTVDVAQPEALTLHLYTGPTVPDVMRAWTLRQGRSAPVPRWAAEGVWLGEQGGPAELRAALARARAADIPVAALWAQDWLGRREFGMGNVGVRYRWSVDPTLYPDLQGLISELGAQGVRFLGYFNPFIVPEQDLYEPAVRQGFIARTAQGEPYTFVISVLTGGVVDLSNPAAVDWFKGYATEATRLGIAGWMQDFGEWLPVDAQIHAGSAARFHNEYPTAWQRAAREALEAARPGGDWILLARSGWLGTAHASQVVWAGDQECNWNEHDGLQTVIPAMTSLGLAGIGWVTHDVAGFSGGPSTKELYQRWTELAAFTPIFRTHEGLRRAENWSWDRDAETTAHFARFARVHRALAPTFMALGEAHRATGMPIVRSMALAFPDDARMLSVLDQYMIGDELLVAPVVTEGATSRAVLLPQGQWFDVWDPSVSHMGGGTITVAAPIGRPPVFSRAARTDLSAVR